MMVYAALRSLNTRLCQPVLRWLLPARCIACGGPCDLSEAPLEARPESTVPLDLCPACWRQLPCNEVACVRCGLPLQGTPESPIYGLICGQCLRRPPRYTRSYCAFEYRYPVAPLIRNLKYGQALASARVLGELLAWRLIQQRQITSESWPACIIPVPLHTRRYRERGYNQVVELGRHLQRRLNIPLRTDLVTRIRHTPEQAGLSRRERRKNLRRAFSTTTTDLPAHVAVLDDVITTGTTVNELAHTLAKAGVARIEVWGLARAPAPHR